VLSKSQFTITDNNPQYLKQSNKCDYPYAGTRH